MSARLTSQRIDRILTSPVVSGVAVDRGNFGTTLNLQPRFRLQGTAKGDRAESIRVVPITEAAQKLLASPIGDKLHNALQQYKASANENGAMLGGVALSVSGRGFSVNSAAGEVEKQLRNRTLSRNARDVADDLEADIAAGGVVGNSAVTDGQWVTLGKTDSNALLNALKNSHTKAGVRDGYYATGTLLHEMQHTIKSGQGKSLAMLSPLEEGAAETLTRWPGHAAELARRMDVSYRPGPAWSYPDEVKGVRALLSLAGIDHQDPASLVAAQQLLRGQSLGNTPGVLAKAIIKEQNLPQSAYDKIRWAITDSAFSVNDRRQFTRLINKLKSESTN